MRNIVALAAVAAAFVASPALAQAVVTNGNFEQPALTSGNYAYGSDANSSGATFNSHAGLASDGSAFGFLPDGSSQVAFLQGSNDIPGDPSIGQISLDVSGLTIGDAYAFSFLAAMRPDYLTNPFDVTFNGVDLGTFTATTDAWTSFTTAPFVANATTGTLTFTGTAPYTHDQDVGIDNVQITGATLTGAVPEPATWAMMLLGFGGISFATRRKRTPVTQIA